MQKRKVGMLRLQEGKRSGARLEEVHDAVRRVVREKLRRSMFIENCL